MKNAVFFAVTLFVFTITETTFAENKSTHCKRMYKYCSNDDDCCTKICSWSLTAFATVCKERVGFVDSIKYMFVPKVEHGMCSYNKSAIDQNSRLNYPLGVASAVLPINIEIDVSAGNVEKLRVKINDRFPDAKDVLLELSPEVAQEMEIKEDGLFPCRIVIPIIENNYFYRGVKHLSPYIITYATIITILILI